MTDGRMMTGWVYSSGKMYYLDQYGQMVTNTTVGNFRVGADGAVIY
jgi:glucan-binding YG repeat protein